MPTMIYKATSQETCSMLALFITNIFYPLPDYKSCFVKSFFLTEDVKYEELFLERAARIVAESTVISLI